MTQPRLVISLFKAPRSAVVVKRPAKRIPITTVPRAAIEQLVARLSRRTADAE